MANDSILAAESERRNDISICMTQFLDAAQDIHIAMARLDGDHGCQDVLNSAMHAVLIGAQQCRQAMKSDVVGSIARALREGEG